MTTLKDLGSLLFVVMAVSAAPITEPPLDEIEPTEENPATITAVYGRDDRSEIFELNRQTYLSAARTVAMVASQEDVKMISDSTAELESVTYGESLNLCKDERFWSQPRIGFCSSVLVAPQLVLTAGHCIVNQKECHDARFIFDVNYESKDKISLQIPIEKIRSCRRIIKRKNKTSGMDYALIELDRPIEDRTPARINKFFSNQNKVFMIGHPMGLPAKFTGPATIYKEDELTWLSDLDSSAGNSGSPVFDNSDGSLIGLFTSGEDGDFVGRTASCQATKECTMKTCYGEVILKIGKILDDESK